MAGVLAQGPALASRGRERGRTCFTVASFAEGRDLAPRGGGVRWLCSSEVAGRERCSMALTALGEPHLVSIDGRALGFCSSQGVRGARSHVDPTFAGEPSCMAEGVEGLLDSVG
jgi:hypothetical protein